VFNKHNVKHTDNTHVAVTLLSTTYLTGMLQSAKL